MARCGLGGALGPYMGLLFGSVRVLSQCLLDSSVFVGSGLLFLRPNPLKWTSTDLAGCAENIINSDVFVT